MAWPVHILYLSPRAEVDFARMTGTLDLQAVKTRQQATWAGGDYAVVASRVALISELLADSAELRAGWQVLDIATGSGNAAIAAARYGADVTGVD